MIHKIPILNSFMTFRDVGSGPAVVFLHGNPTSSRVWREVIPYVAERHRCLAPDLIGMGDSGKPEIAYRFTDHTRYLDEWFEALGLREVVLVGYDWGGSLAMDWATRHPDRVRGLVVFETFLRPMEWKEWSPRGAELFRAVRTPGVGEKMVLRGERVPRPFDDERDPTPAQCGRASRLLRTVPRLRVAPPSAPMAPRDPYRRRAGRRSRDRHPLRRVAGIVARRP